MQNKKQLDINETIGSLKFTFDNEVTPLKNGLELFKKQNSTLAYVSNLSKESEELSHDINKNTLKISNLLKIINNNMKLEKLNNIDEVYQSKVDILEEVLYYHNSRLIRKNEIQSNLSNEEEILNDSNES